MRVRVLIPLIVSLLISGASWAFDKPVRVLAPEQSGVTCVTEAICVEDMARYEEASVLYEQAFGFVNAVVGAIDGKGTSMARSGRVVTAPIGDRTRRLARAGGAS